MISTVLCIKSVIFTQFLQNMLNFFCFPLKGPVFLFYQLHITFAQNLCQLAKQHIIWENPHGAGSKAHLLGILEKDINGGRSLKNFQQILCFFHFPVLALMQMSAFCIPQVLRFHREMPAPVLLVFRSEVLLCLRQIS